MTLLSCTIFLLLEINIKLVLCKNVPADSFEITENRSEDYELIFAHIVSECNVLSL